MAFDTPIKIGTNLDLGTAIDVLIKKNIKAINTCFLAQVKKVNGNKVSVVDLIKPNKEANNPIIHNCLVAQPFSNDFSLSFKIKENDIGICIVCKQDITNFKENGGESVANTQRVFSISDSIFIPLSLFNSNVTSNEIKSNSKLSIKASDIEIKGKASPLVIGNDIGTLSDLVDSLVQLLDLLASGMTGSTTNAGAYQNGKNAIIQKIKKIVG